MSALVPLTFRIFRGARLLREQTLALGVIKVGRAPSAQLQIDDESIGRVHAVLEVDGGGAVHVIDLGSTRGTLVNGLNITKARLTSGDAIQLGDIRLELVIGVRGPDVRGPDAFDRMSDDAAVGARSIEVAAMLGESVVGVKHCIDPKSGTISPWTWATAIAGLACLVASAIAFHRSVATAASNQSALDYWTRVAHKPMYAYRPETLSLGYDWLAFGGFALGLVAVAAAIARIRDERRSPYYRIGTAPGVELALEGAPTASFPLVAPAGDDFVFNYGPGIDGEVIVDGRITPLSQVAGARPSPTTGGAIEVPIPTHGRIRARSGQTTFVVCAVPRPRRHTTPLWSGLESRAIAYFAGSLGAHLALWALLQQIPEEAGGLAVDIAEHEESAIRDHHAAQETAPPPADDQVGDTGDNAAAGNPMQLESGASGKPTAVAVEGHVRVKTTERPPQLARQQAIEEARSAGILGSLSASGGFASITSVADLSSGLDDANAWGAMVGADGESAGTFGHGRTGFDVGAGCAEGPCGLIGSGGYNLIGIAGHLGTGYEGPLGGGPGTRRHVAAVPQPRIGEPITVGDYPKAIIRRYIKRNVEKISYCYERELLAHPGLEGTVLVQFFILPGGAVKSSTGSGFDAAVATCVAGVIGSITFPKPDGGGVLVNYPFTFHASGS